MSIPRHPYRYRNTLPKAQNMSRWERFELRHPVLGRIGFYAATVLGAIGLYGLLFLALAWGGPQ